ncbi:MAG TPA: xylulose 5-phosphate 3-epimerase [Chloroflexi bacterium]|nr:xylulose 5-phosphate 3-epimerase [Chloroflexota bacterium]
MGANSVLPVGLYEKALPPDWSWEERLCGAGEAGYDFVEISIDESNLRLARLDWPASKRVVLRRAIADSGVPILTVCLSGHRKYPLGSHSLEVRRRGLDILQKTIALASEIGVRVVQVMGYDVFYEPSNERTEARFVEGLREGIEWASQAGVMLGLENVDMPLVDSIGKAMRFVRELNSPWFQLYADMGNLVGAGYSPPDELPLAAGHLVAMHVKDARRGVIRGVPFEEGAVPFVETFHTLARIGFCGPLTVELWADMDPTGEPVRSAATARHFVERLLTASWPEKVPAG